MRRRLIAAAAAVLTAGLAATVPAAADLAQPKQVSANPVDYTPHVLGGMVWDIAMVGARTVVVVGDFSELTDASGRTLIKRQNLFAYDLYTGVVQGLSATFDGPVYAVSPAPDGASIYLGGDFRKVNGFAQRGLARINLATGQRVPAFTGAIQYGDVRELAVRGPWLYVGGAFNRVGGVDRPALARLSLETGAADPAFDARIAAPSLSRARVEDFVISPDGTRLVAIGAIEQAGGQARAQLAMYDIAANPPRLADWYTDAYAPKCRAGFDTYMRGIDFAPDSRSFVVVTTGRSSHPQRTCDTAARFNVAGTGMHRPVWVNHTGGDSLYAVSVTGTVAYVGGHQRWMNNPYGHESAGRGAVSRKGIGAIDMVTGRATDWNPTRDRGVGVRAFLSTPAGLLVGSDTERLGREYHGRIGMFPLG
jgi:hypothetical protein